MLLTIHDKTGKKKAELSPDDSSTQVKEIQGDNVLTLSFPLHRHVPLDVDDYVDFLEERYRLCERFRPRQKSTMEWAYDLKLYGIESMIKNWLVVKMVDGEQDPVFTLTAPPREHVAMIVKCMNDAGGHAADWKVGRVEGTDNITIDYFGKYCDEALKELAEKTETEYWMEGATVNLCRCEHGERITLGYDKGLTSIDPGTANNVKFYTRLYPKGSSRNIDPEKYGHSRLQLPEGRKFVEVNADKYGRVDHYEEAAFADIYPRRVGKVTSVRSEERTGDDGNPFTVWYFKDNSLAFDPNEYLIRDKVMRVSFQEGSELAGLGNEDNGTYYFEVNFDSKTKEFEIITIWPYDDDRQLPGYPFIPAAGNEYILWNMRMPDEYYTLAERELLEAVNDFNDKHSVDIAIFKAPTDHVWIEQEEADLFVGRRVRLESAEYFPETGYRDSRITKITRKVNLPSQMDLEIGDALSRTAMQKMSDGIEDAKSYARTLVESGSLPDIIRTGDETKPTDNNLFSAKRTLSECLSRREPDTATGLKRLLDGIEVGDYATGIKGAAVTKGGDAEVESAKVRRDATVGNGLSVGKRVTVGDYIPGVSGAVMWVDSEGEAHFVTDYLTVNKKMMVKEVEIQSQTWVGGSQISSPAGMVCGRMEPVISGLGGTSSITGYKCFFRADTPDGTAVHNEFRAGDLARCETFNLVDEGGMLANRYYWRKVTSASTEATAETDGAGDRWHWIVLSNRAGEYDPKSESAPAVGDSIITFGNGTDETRQNVIVISSYGEGSPYIYQFAGINSFSTKGKIKTRISPNGNVFTGKFLVEAEGKNPEDIEDIIDRRKPYSLIPSTSMVLVSRIPADETHEEKIVFSPSAFTCGVFRNPGTGDRQRVGWSDLAALGMKVQAVIRTLDPETGNFKDSTLGYSGQSINSTIAGVSLWKLTEGVRSVIFRLLAPDGSSYKTIDETAVSVQTDATGLASEYRASLEVTEKAITQQVEKTNLLESLYASLKVTAGEISSKVGRTSANLIKWRSPMWDNPSQDLGVTNVQSEGGFDAEQEYELTQEWQTFRCPMETSRFKPSTDYVLSLDIMFQDDEWEQVISGNRMAFRAGVCDAPQTTFLLPWATPLQKGVDEIYYPKVEYDPGYMESIIFRFKTPAVLPTGPMFLSLILRWDQQAQQEGPLVLSTRLMKLEEGTVPTAWVPADKDLESIIEQQAGQIAMSVMVDGKERAGLTLDAEEGITMQADKVKIKNGDQTAALFIGGILNAALIVVSKLMTVGKDGSTRVTIGEFDDPFIRFYHEDGVTVAMKLGLDYVSLEEKPTITPSLSPSSDETDDDTGEAAKIAVSGDSTAIPIFKKGKECVMQVFDATGKLTWVMFTTGPVTPDTQTYSWRVLSLVPPGSISEAQAKTTLDFKTQEYWQFKVSGDNAVAPYKNYKDKVFIKKLSDSNFSSPAAYLANGRFYFPTAEMKPATVGGSDPGWRRGYYDITAGTLSSIKYLDVTP